MPSPSMIVNSLRRAEIENEALRRQSGKATSALRRVLAEASASSCLSEAAISGAEVALVRPNGPSYHCYVRNVIDAAEEVGRNVALTDPTVIHLRDAIRKAGDYWQDGLDEQRRLAVNKAAALSSARKAKAKGRA
ncbi:MAG: hypothetical protein JWN72_760 [Thermoleophilia bacterium]|nr:hypothetical protein [Thermoleophilia bacterium]